MSEETRDEVTRDEVAENEVATNEVARYKVLQKIKTQEEYEDAKKRLEYYMKEYTWMQESENPMLEVRTEMQKLLPMLNGEKTESQKYFSRCVNLLTSKSQQIASGEYLTNLKSNITALLVTTREYEQRQKDYNLLDILKGIIKRDKAILEALRINNIFERIMAFGNVPAEKDLSLQDPAYLVEYIGKHYNLVGIKVPDYQKNLALVPVSPEGRITKEQEFISEMVSEYMNPENKVSKVSDDKVQENKKQEDKEQENKKQKNKEQENKEQENKEPKHGEKKHTPSVQKREETDSKGEVNK